MFLSEKKSDGFIKERVKNVKTKTKYLVSFFVFQKE